MRDFFYAITNLFSNNKSHYFVQENFCMKIHKTFDAQDGKTFTAI